MQRTVTFTKYTFADTKLADNGTVESKLKTVVVREANPRKAYRQACKEVGKKFEILKEEQFEKIYKLDDETFFKYATEVAEDEKTSTN